MPDNVKQNGVIWFDKTGLSIYLENKPFLRLNFTPDTFSNLEIVDRAKLENSIRGFINQNKLNYLSYILILTSDVLFEKDWPIPQSETQLKEEAEFVESIPFENTIIHAWVRDNKKKVIATNEDYIYFLKEIFEKENGRLVGAFPYSLFGANVRNESVKEIWRNINNFKQDNLVEIGANQQPLRSNNPTQQNSEQKKSSLPFLIVIFVILLSVLGYLMFKK
jgi:hypothetical protein